VENYNTVYKFYNTHFQDAENYEPGNSLNISDCNYCKINGNQPLLGSSNLHVSLTLNSSLS